MTHRELVLVEVNTSDGQSGTGWCTTAGVGAASAEALITGYLAPMLTGMDPRNTEQIWQRLWMECHAAVVQTKMERVAFMPKMHRS